MSPTQAPVRRIGYAPITRIDTTRREIEVTATSEALDAYGTIFAYEASRDAFARWLGNVREMHDAVAVGKRVAVAYDPDHRAVRVRLRISAGAESTWQKILDGTLCGASIGAANVTWQELARDQLPDTLRAEPNLRDTVRVATAYDLVELSLVDSPANPDCIGITLVRASMPDVDLLDPLDDEDAPPEPVDTVVTASPPGPLSIFGAPSPKTERGSHDIPQPPSSKTETGSRDIPQSASVSGGAGETDNHAASEAQRLMLAETRRLAATMAALYATVERVAREQHARLADLAERLARIEAQPLPGGPILRAAEKTLGFTGAAQVANLAERIAALQTFAASATDQRTQVEVAAEILRLQRGE